MKASQLFVLSVVLLATEPLIVLLLFDLLCPPTFLSNHSHPPFPQIQLLTKIPIHKKSLVNGCLCSGKNLPKPKTLASTPPTLGHPPNLVHKHMNLLQPYLSTSLMLINPMLPSLNILASLKIMIKPKPNLKRSVQPKNLTQLLLPLFQTLLGTPQKALTTLLPILQPLQISKRPQPPRKVKLLKISLFLIPPSLSHLPKLLLLPFYSLQTMTPWSQIHFPHKTLNL